MCSTFISIQLNDLRRKCTCTAKEKHRASQYLALGEIGVFLCVWRSYTISTSDTHTHQLAPHYLASILLADRTSTIFTFSEQRNTTTDEGARCLDFFCSCSQLVTVDQRFDFVEVFARAELLVVYVPIEQQWDDNFVQSTKGDFAGIGLFTMSLRTVLVPDGMLRALIEIKQHRFCDSQ